MKKKLRIRCYYCDELLVVDFYDMRKADTADKTLKQNGWVFGVAAEDGDVFFDPLCHGCGRGVFKSMIENGGGKIDPEAKKTIQQLYPDLFEGPKD